jgi:hypothetical protein
MQDPFKFIQDLLQSTDPASARALIDQIYAPAREEINNQIAQSQANAQARASQMQQVYGAFAQYMGGLSGNLQSIYAAGKADGNALASGMSGPTGAVGDHLANMQGIQNTYLGAMGSAEGQLGASMPGVYSLMATQQVKNMLNAAGASQDQLRAKLLDLSSQEASDILKYLDSAQSKDVQLKEWAYGQQQTSVSQQASRDLAYKNYIQRQGELNFEHDLQSKKFTFEQAQQREKNWVDQQMANYRSQNLTDRETAQANLQGYRATTSGQADQRIAIARHNAQQAMIKQNRLVPAPVGVSQAAHHAMLWNPVAKTYVPAVDAKGNFVPYQGGAGKTPTSKTPGSVPWAQGLQQTRAARQKDIATSAAAMAAKYITKVKGVQFNSGAGTKGTGLSPKQKAQVRATIFNTYGQELMTIARQLQLYKKLPRADKSGKALTPRNWAEYWINKALGPGYK